MWPRHVLIGFVGLLGIGVVGAQLKKERLESPETIATAYTDLDFKATVDEVDSQFQTHWQDLSLQPAERADTLLVARRLSLSLVGTVPSLEEIRTLESIDPDLQLTWWLDHLLTDRRYSDYAAERFARAFVGT